MSAPDRWDFQMGLPALPLKQTLGAELQHQRHLHQVLPRLVLHLPCEPLLHRIVYMVVIARCDRQVRLSLQPLLLRDPIFSDSRYSFQEIPPVWHQQGLHVARRLPKQYSVDTCHKDVLVLLVLCSPTELVVGRLKS